MSKVAHLKKYPNVRIVGSGLISIGQRKVMAGSHLGHLCSKPPWYLGGVKRAKERSRAVTGHGQRGSHQCRLTFCLSSSPPISPRIQLQTSMPSLLWTHVAFSLPNISLISINEKRQLYKQYIIWMYVVMLLRQTCFKQNTLVE